MSRVVCWFSCGVTSAVAAKLAVTEYGNPEVVYCDTGGEHHTNKKFLEDVQEWIGVSITILKSDKYQDHFDVFEKTGWINGPKGARCTIELKKKLREDYQRAGDTHIFGYDVNEQERATNIQENMPELSFEFNLIDNQLTKSDCLALITGAGIELPEMYKLGYNHNNCIGCPKGQMGYWNKIRVDFPDVFERMSMLEQEMNVAVNKSYAGDGERKKLFLNDLDPEVGRKEKLPPIECGLFCDAVRGLF